MGFVSRFFSIDIQPNAMTEDTIDVSLKLLKEAKRSIKIVTGELNSFFYKDDRTQKELSRAANKGVSIEIAYLASRDTDSDFAKEFTKSIPAAKMIEIKDKEEAKRHWMVVDGKHVRIEREHPVGLYDSAAIIIRDARPLAEEYSRKFGKIEESR